MANSIYDFVPATRGAIEKASETEDISVMDYIRAMYPEEYKAWLSEERAMPTQTFDDGTPPIPGLTGFGVQEIEGEQRRSPFYETEFQKKQYLAKKKASADDADKRLAGMEKSSGESIYAFMKNKPISYKENIPAKEAVIQENADGSETILEPAVPASQVTRTARGKAEIEALAKKQGLSAFQLIEQASPDTVKQFTNAAIKKQVSRPGVQMQTSAATPRNVSNFNNANQWSNFYSNQENQMAPPDRQPNMGWYIENQYPSLSQSINQGGTSNTANDYWFNLANPYGTNPSQMTSGIHEQSGWLPVRDQPFGQEISEDALPNVNIGPIAETGGGTNPLGLNAEQEAARWGIPMDGSMSVFDMYDPDKTLRQSQDNLYPYQREPYQAYVQAMRKRLQPTQADILSSGQALGTGYYPTYGGFLLGRALGAEAPASGMPLPGNPFYGGPGASEAMAAIKPAFGTYAAQDYRPDLASLRKGFGGLGKALRSPAGVGPSYGLAGFSPGEEGFSGNLLAAAEAALGTGGSARGHLGSVFNTLSNLYKPSEAASKFADYVGSAFTGYRG